MSEFINDGEQGKTVHSCYRSSLPFRVIEMPVPYTLTRVVELLRRHYPDLQPEMLQEYLDRRGSGLVEKYSKLTFESYKVTALSKREHHLVKLRE